MDMDESNALELLERQAKDGNDNLDTSPISDEYLDEGLPRNGISTEVVQVPMSTDIVNNEEVTPLKLDVDIDSDFDMNTDDVDELRNKALESIEDSLEENDFTGMIESAAVDVLESLFPSFSDGLLSNDDSELLKEALSLLRAICGDIIVNTDNSEFFRGDVSSDQLKELNVKTSETLISRFSENFKTLAALAVNNHGGNKAFKILSYVAEMSEVLLRHTLMPFNLLSNTIIDDGSVRLFTGPLQIYCENADVTSGYEVSLSHNSLRTSSTQSDVNGISAVLGALIESHNHPSLYDAIHHMLSGGLNNAAIDLVTALGLAKSDVTGFDELISDFADENVIMDYIITYFDLRCTQLLANHFGENTVELYGLPAYRTNHIENAFIDFNDVNINVFSKHVNCYLLSNPALLSETSSFDDWVDSSFIQVSFNCNYVVKRAYEDALFSTTFTLKHVIRRLKTLSEPFNEFIEGFEDVTGSGKDWNEEMVSILEFCDRNNILMVVLTDLLLGGIGVVNLCLQGLGQSRFGYGIDNVKRFRDALGYRVNNGSPPLIHSAIFERDYDVLWEGSHSVINTFIDGVSAIHARASSKLETGFNDDEAKDHIKQFALPDSNVELSDVRLGSGSFSVTEDNFCVWHVLNVELDSDFIVSVNGLGKISTSELNFSSILLSPGSLRSLLRHHES